MEEVAQPPFYDIRLQVTETLISGAIERLYLFNISGLPRRGEQPWSQHQAVFTTIDYKDSRAKLKEQTGPGKTSMYRGALHKQVMMWWLAVRYSFDRVIECVRGFFTFFVLQFKLAIRWLIDLLLRLPIIRKYNIKKNQFNIRMGYPELKPVTEQAITQQSG